MKVNLVTGRTLEQGEGVEKGKTSEDYFRDVATVYLCEEDIGELGLKDDSSVKVSTRAGSVVVNYREGELDPGMAFMPLGPWASRLMSSDTSGVGIPKSKGIEAEVIQTEEEVTTLEAIMSSLGD